VPVSSTGGEVLAVPLAALTAGPGGEARVELVDGEDDDGTLLEVTTGLSADGFVEVTPVDGDLAEGDLVVVGAAGTGAGTEDETDGGEDDDGSQDADAQGTDG
jgi:hypothetical protein